MAKNQTAKPVDLRELASEYKELALRIKALEDLQKPLKSQILDAINKQNLEGNVDLGAVLVVRSSRVTQDLNSAAITPDWLYRFQECGGRISAKLDTKDAAYGNLDALLDEVNYSERVTPTFTFKLQAE